MFLLRLLPPPLYDLAIEKHALACTESRQHRRQICLSQELRVKNYNNALPAQHVMYH